MHFETVVKCERNEPFLQRGGERPCSRFMCAQGVIGATETVPLGNVCGRTDSAAWRLERFDAGCFATAIVIFDRRRVPCSPPARGGCTLIGVGRERQALL